MKFKNNTLKVIHIIPTLKRGGAERLVINICYALQKIKDIHVQLISLSKENDYEELTVNLSDYKVIECKPSFSVLKKKNFKKHINLQNHINSINPDIIHTHLWETEIITSKIYCSTAAWVTHFHSNIFQLEKKLFFKNKNDIILYFERKLMLRTYLKRDGHFIAISNNTYEYAKKVLPKIFKKKIYKLYNAIDFDFFFNNNDKLITRPLKLITVGSLIRIKNHRLAIDIVKTLIDHNINSVLTILGEGSEKESLLKYIIKNNLQENIIFEGNVANVEKYLNSSHIYIHSAFSEGFGLAILEAMACGLPALCFTFKGSEILIDHEKNGFLIDKPKPKLFLKIINRLINSPSLYKKISISASKKAKKFDIKEYAKQLITFYKSIKN